MSHGSLTDKLGEILDIFGETEEPLTTPEVADRHDLGRRTAYNRLQRLVEAGRLETKKVGASARVWWRPRASIEQRGDADAEVGRSEQVTRVEQQFRALIEATDEYAIFLLDPEGYVQTWNPGAARIKGYDAEDILDEHFSTFYTEAARENSVPERNLQAAAHEGSVRDQGWRLRDDGTRFWASVTITAIRDENGDLVGYAKVTRDMTDQKRRQAERELHYETAHDIARAESFTDGLRAALQDVCDLTDWEYAEVWVPTADGKLRRTDIDYYEAEYTGFAVYSEGYTLERNEGLPGRVWATGEFEWATDFPNGSLETYPRVDRAVEADLKSSLGVPVVRDNEVVAVLTFLMSDIRDTDERLVEIVSSVAADLGNLVARRQVEAEIKQERDLIDQILAVSPTGIQVVNQNEEITRVNDRAREFFDICGDGTDSTAFAETTMYNADREAVAPDQHPFSQVLKTGEAVFDWQARVELQGGGYRWVTINAAPVLDADGEVERVVLTSEDITGLKEQTRRVERQREELKRELEEFTERISDGFYALDSEFRVTYVNDHAEELLGLEESTVVGRDIREAMALTDQFEAALHRAFEEETTVRIEDYFQQLDAWFESTIYFSESGVSVFFRDITARKNRERALEQYEAVAEGASEVILIIDDESRIRSVNPAVEEVFGYTPDELLGESLTVLMPERLTDVHERGVAEYLRMGERTLNWDQVELPGVTADGTEIPLSISFNEHEPAGQHQFTGIVLYITERKQREQALRREERRLQTLVDNFPNGAVALVDRDLRYATFGGTAAGEAELTRDDTEGRLLRDVLPGELAEVTVPRYEAALEGQSSNFVAPVDDRVYQFQFLPIHDEGGEVFQALGLSQDITEQKERERELRNRIRQQEVVTDLGTRALEDLDLDTLMDEAARLVAETLGTEYCKVLELDPNEDELLLRQGVGWDEGVVGEAAVSAVEDSSQAAYTLASEAPVLVTDLQTEPRFSGPDLLRDHDVRSGISTIIGPADDPWGILGTHDSDTREFSGQDATFVQAVANILAAAIERHRHEEELLRQREQLAALNSLKEVVLDITSAVIEQSTRTEIERTVCERLAATDSYLFAWTGDVDPNTETVDVRAEAGVEGYLDDVTISIDPGNPRSDGPTGRALRTGEIQVISHVDVDRYEPWRQAAEEYGFRSSAAVPIVHDKTVYGVLNLYAGRPNAFTGRERTMLTQLGEVVGHAIAAAERKQALMSDELVELEFQVRDVFSALGSRVTTEEKITFEHMLAIGDGEFLVYGSTVPDAMESIRDLVDSIPFWESVTVRSEGETTYFELRLTESPVLSVVASQGGYIVDSVIEDGDLGLTVHLAPTVGVRQVIDTVKDEYPGARMVRRRQITRDRDELHPSSRQFVSELTDRQRSALEAAYYAGYFEWPRDASGEQVADSLGVSPPTFHQHLRKAQRKVFEAVFSASV